MDILYKITILPEYSGLRCKLCARGQIDWGKPMAQASVTGCDLSIPGANTHGYCALFGPHEARVKTKAEIARMIEVHLKRWIQADPAKVVVDHRWSGLGCTGCTHALFAANKKFKACELGVANASEYGYCILYVPAAARALTKRDLVGLGERHVQRFIRENSNYG